MISLDHDRAATMMAGHADDRALWIIKLGGSLASSPTLKNWLDTIVEHGAGRVIIVPGGGPFADAVRLAQAHWRFDDAAAHCMALLAMEQYAWMLRGLRSDLVLADSVASMHDAMNRMSVPIWLPFAMVSSSDLAATWDITADTLAGWLAVKLNANSLVLVKSCVLSHRDLPLNALAQLEIVDRALPTMVKQGRFKTFIVNKEHHQLLSRILQQEQVPIV